MLVVEASGRELITSYKFIDLLVKKGVESRLQLIMPGGNAKILITLFI